MWVPHLTKESYLQRNARLYTNWRRLENTVHGLPTPTKKVQLAGSTDGSRYPPSRSQEDFKFPGLRCSWNDDMEANIRSLRKLAFGHGYGVRKPTFFAQGWWKECGSPTWRSTSLESQNVWNHKQPSDIRHHVTSIPCPLKGARNIHKLRVFTWSEIRPFELHGCKQQD